ncbi:methyltransferase [Nonomuraea typhae]|uniref:methyltransferase n=1 Tax=Nonomuraea typhae TaxID=2603600 RepID=UPI0012FA3C4A|nr:methyltransferase [Nonomuraea typhae]
MTANPSQPPDAAPIMILGRAFWGARTLISAVELGVFTELAQGGLTLEQLRERLRLHERGARDFLDALVALGMLQRSGGLYANTPATAYYLDRARPTYIGDLMELAGDRGYGSWASLTTALRTGRAQSSETAGGEDLFQSMYTDEEAMRRFLKGMTGLTLPTARAIAAAFPFEKYTTFLDVGGARGALAVQLAEAHPHLTGGVFDLPQVRPLFTEYVTEHGLSHRLSFYAGDFLTGPLPQAEILVMGHVLHDWDLETKRLLLRKAYEALPEGGALIVYETLIDDERATNAPGLLMSLNMLVNTLGGFDFTGADCAEWMLEAGFASPSVTRLPALDGMVVGIKGTR